MSKSFKIRKYWVLTFVMMFSFISFGHDFKSITDFKSNDKISGKAGTVLISKPFDTIPHFGKNTSNIVLTTQCFEGNIAINSPLYGENGSRMPMPGIITYINASGQTITVNGLWIGYGVTITYQSIISQQNIKNCSTPTATLVSAAGTNAQTKCINTAITQITYTIANQYSFENPTVTGLPSGVTYTYALGVKSINISGTPTVSGSFIYTINLKDSGGGPVSVTGSITLNGGPMTLSAGSGASNQSNCINTTIAPIKYTASLGATGVTFSGLPSGVTGTFTSNIATISGTPTVLGSFPYSVNLTGSCGTSATTGTLIVTPSSTVSVASASPTLCINNILTAITHTTAGVTSIAGTPVGLPSGVNATWNSNVLTISGTPTTAGTFNYSVPLSGCGTVNATGTIIVNPSSTVSAASVSPTLCINTSMTTITHTTTGVTSIAGTPVGLPSGVNAVWVSNMLTINGTPTTAGTFNYSIPLTGSCGTVNATGTISVNPSSTVSVASVSPTLCVNTSMTTITHTTTGVTNLSGTPSGLPSGIIASWAGNTLTISGTPTTTGTFNYSVPLNGNCGTVNATGRIIITPSTSVSAASASPTLCINIGMPAINHTTVGVTGISGTPSGLPSGVNASWTSNILTINGTPATAGNFTYFIPLTGSCGNVNATGTIIVKPDSTVSGGSSSSLCINTTLTAITHSTTGVTSIAGAPLGLPSGVSATWASNLLTINGTPTTAGNFTYSIPLTDGCRTINATGTIIVNPNATMSLTSTAGTNAQTKCINTPIETIVYTSTGAGTAIFTGLPAGVTGSVALTKVVRIIGTPTVSGTFPYTVAFQTCGTPTASGTITILPDNTITLTSGQGTDNQSRNINTAINLITYNVTGATNISFSGLPAGVNGNFTSNTVTISGIPTALGISNYIVTLTNGCGLVLTAQGMINVLCQPISGTIKVIKNLSYPFFFSSGKSTSTLACAETVFPIKFYAASTTLGINTQLYVNEGLTQPVTNGGLWYQNRENITSYKINNNGKTIEISTCQPSGSTQTYRFYARHPIEHNGEDSVIYIDKNGIEKTLILIRTDNVSENPCQEIEVQRIIQNISAGDCDSRG